MNPIGASLRGLIRLYQLTIPALTGPACRFAPSCSEYAREAILVHGALLGSWLALKRIARCNPWGGSGYDPVPPLAQSTRAPSGRTCGHEH
jgi:putative membrane protein insertion efficiency factor